MLTGKDSLYYQKAVNWNVSGQRQSDVHSLAVILEQCEAEIKKTLGQKFAFSSPLIIELIDGRESVFVNTIAGNTVLYLAKCEPRKEKWILEAYLARWAKWTGISKNPPSWLLAGLEMRLKVKQVPAIAKVIVLQLKEGSYVPSLSTLISNNSGISGNWYYLLLKFLKEGGLSNELYQSRLQQYWKTGYDWTQLAVFFEKRYSKLNASELDLLWRTFVSEELNMLNDRFFNELDSLGLMRKFAEIAVSLQGEEKIILADEWFLYQNEPWVIQNLKKKQNELKVIVLRIHPFFYNACHSLNLQISAILGHDLESFRGNARQFHQDMLDAEQLMYESDLLLERVCE